MSIGSTPPLSDGGRRGRLEPNRTESPTHWPNRKQRRLLRRPRATIVRVEDSRCNEYLARKLSARGASLNFIRALYFAEARTNQIGRMPQRRRDIDPAAARVRASGHIDQVLHAISLGCTGRGAALGLACINQ